MTLWTVACQVPLSMGFSRQKYRSELPFTSSGDLPNPGIKPTSPAWQVDSLPLSHQGSLHIGATCLSGVETLGIAPRIEHWIKLLPVWEGNQTCGICYVQWVQRAGRWGCSRKASFKKIKFFFYHDSVCKYVKYSANSFTQNVALCHFFTHPIILSTLNHSFSLYF